MITFFIKIMNFKQFFEQFSHKKVNYKKLFVFLKKQYLKMKENEGKSIEINENS